MTHDEKLDVLLDRTSQMAATIATQTVHLEYLGRSDADTRQRVTALERWRWTLAGLGVAAAMLAEPFWSWVSRH